VRGVKAYDEAAFKELVARHEKKVFSIIHRILRNRNDSEDVAQQVFVSIYFGIDGRKKKRRRLIYESDLSIEEGQSGFSDRVADPGPAADRRLAEHDFVLKLLSKLPEEDRVLLVLKEVEGHSIEEPAALIGLNKSTVKTRLFRIRQKLMGAARRLGNMRKMARSPLDPLPASGRKPACLAVAV
jgi:RNA polymerase sigma-70 factor (ECF subfamily)